MNKMSNNNEVKLGITWQEPESFSELDIGYIGHVESWTVSAQVTIKESRIDSTMRDQADIYVIDFDGADPIVVSHQVIEINKISTALKEAEKSIAAYIESISNLNIGLHKETDIWTK